MTQQEILEGNKLIAEFMGYKFGIHKFLIDEGDEFNYKFKPYYNGIIYKDKLPENTIDIKNGNNFHEYTEGYDKNLDYRLVYNNSWNLLIPVTQKLLKEGWVTIFYSNMCNITDIKSFIKQEENNLPFFETYSLNNETLIEAVWLSVVDCIKWNNEYGR